MSILENLYTVTMPDGSEWAVTVRYIAEHRAACYANEFEGDLQRSLAEDTVPLFAADAYEVHDWAANNLDWAEVRAIAVQVAPAEIDHEAGWANGAYRITAPPEPLDES